MKDEDTWEVGSEVRPCRRRWPLVKVMGGALGEPEKLELRGSRLQGPLGETALPSRGPAAVKGSPRLISTAFAAWKELSSKVRRRCPAATVRGHGGCVRCSPWNPTHLDVA